MPHLAEGRAPASSAALVEVQQVAHAGVGVGEALGGPVHGAVDVGVAGDEQVGPAVAVDVADGGARVPADRRRPGRFGAPR